MPPDYGAALWVPADSSNYRAALRRSFDQVLTHITDGRPDPMAVAKMWQQPNHKSSAHFVIGQAGQIIQCVRLRDVAWHAHAANGRSIGIEHCARTAGELGPGDPGLAISPAQYAASAKLQAWLIAGAGLPPTREYLLGHDEADPATTHKDCPTGRWDWATFLPLVEAEYAALSAPG